MPVKNMGRSASFSLRGEDDRAICIPPLADLHISDGTLQRARQIDMEERSVEAMDDGHFLTGALRVGLACAQGSAEIAAAGFGGGVARDDAVVCQLLARGFDVTRALAFEFLFVFGVLGRGGGAVEAADLGDGEDGFPAFEDGGVAFGGGVAEPGGGEGPFCPAVVDAGEVPVYLVGGGVAVELVAHVDEVLDAGYVDVVDGGEVEDYGFKGGERPFDCRSLSAAWAGVVPWSVLLREVLVWRVNMEDIIRGGGGGVETYAESAVAVGVCTLGFLEDGGDHVVEVVVCVGVVEAF